MVTVAFLANAIRTYFGDGSEFGVRMVYATEETPLGTAGSVRNAMDELDEPFLVISGDVLTDIDLAAVVEFHARARRRWPRSASRPMENPLEFGIVITREDGSIERFLEKPTWGQVFTDTINTGIYVLEPEIFDYIPAGEPVDFSERGLPRLLEDGAARSSATWPRATGRTSGTLEAYIKAHQDILDGQVAGGDRRASRCGPGVWLGEGSEIDPTADGRRPGDHRRQLPGRGRAPVLGEYTDARLQRAGRRGRRGRSGRWCTTTATSAPACGCAGRWSAAPATCAGAPAARRASVLGDECFVGEHAVIQPGVKVYPFKTVEPGAIVNSSIVWESRGPANLFGRDGVPGLANVDITPELAVRLAMAYGHHAQEGRRRSWRRATPAGRPGCSSGR